jgi:hypothetical protein
MTQKAWLFLLVVLMSLLPFRAQGRSQSPPASPLAQEPLKCSLDSLPSDIQNPLKKDFASWRIQEAETLSERARKTWEARNPKSCPGIAMGLFQGSTTPSYGILLVSTDHPDAGYKLIVFSRPEGKPLYEAFEIGHSNDPGASNYFIGKVVLSDIFGEESKKKYNAQAPEGILMVDSAEQEYKADVYFLSNHAWRREPAPNNSLARIAQYTVNNRVRSPRSARSGLRSLVSGHFPLLIFPRS